VTYAELMILWLLANLEAVRRVNNLAVADDHELRAQVLMSIGEGELAAAYRALRERWDGDGRPHGLWGTQMPVSAQAYAVAAEYCRLLATMPAGDALAVMQREAGRRYDPEMVAGLAI
jgi:response regulator RpfG family c-di-GMP phosphodiesterase